MAGRIDLPTLVQRIRVDTRSMTAAEKKATKFARTIEKDFEGAKDSAEGLAEATDEIGEAAGRAERPASRLGKAIRAQRRSTRDAAVENSLLARSLRDVADGFNRTARSGGGLASTLSLLKIPAIAGSLGVAAGAVSALGAGLVVLTGQLVSAAVPLTGVVAALPAALGALKSSTAVFKVLTEGPLEAAKAIKQYGRDSQQAADAFNVLNPEARRFTNELTAMSDRFDRLKKAAQAAALPGFTQALREANTLMPILRRAMTGVGESLSRVARLAGRTFTTDAFSRDLGLIASRNARLVDTLGRSSVRLISALRGVVVAAGPMVDTFAAATLGLSRFLDQTANSTSGRAQMEAFFQRTTDAVFGTLRGLRDLTVGLRNFGRTASAALGIDFVGGIGDGIRQFREFTESLSGQNRISAYFEGARPALVETGLLLRDLVKAFAGLGANPHVAPLIAQLRTELLPAILDLVTSTAQELVPALVSAATAFVRMFTVISASPLAAFAVTLAEIANGVTEIIASSSALSTLVGTVIALAAAFKAVAFASKTVGLTGLVTTLTSIGTAGTAGATGVAGFVQGLKGFNTEAGKSATTANRFGGVIRGLAGSAAFGPLGLAVAASTGIFAVWMKQKSDAKARVQGLTDAIRADAGALGEHSRAVAADILAQNGSFENAKRLGIELDQLVDAYLGIGGAAKDVQATLSRFDVSGPQRGMNATQAAASQLATALGIGREETSKAQAAAQDYAAAMGTQATATDRATGANERYGAALQGSFTSRALSAASAQNALKRATTAARDAINSKRRVTLAESDALIALAEQANQTADAVHNQTNSVHAANDVLRASAANFIATATAMGMSRREAVRLAESYGLIPTVKKTKVEQPGMPGAIGNTKLLHSLIDGIPSLKTVTILINTVETRSEAESRGTGENPRQADAAAAAATDAAAARSARAAEAAARRAAERAARRAGDSIAKGAGRGAADGIADIIPKTEDIAKEADKKATEAEKAAERLKEARKKIIQEAREAARGLAEGIRGMGNVVGSGNEEEGTNILRIIGHLREKVAAAKRFTKDLRELVKRGINPVTFRQIVEAGPEAGGPAAKALAAATDAQFEEVNSLQRKLNTTATAAKGVVGKELVRVGLNNLPQAAAGGTSIGTQIGKQVNIQKVEQNFHNPKQETQTESSNKALRRMSATLERA